MWSGHITVCCHPLKDKKRDLGIVGIRWNMLEYVGIRWNILGFYHTLFLCSRLALNVVSKLRTRGVSWGFLVTRMSEGRKISISGWHFVYQAAWASTYWLHSSDSSGWQDNAEQTNWQGNKQAKKHPIKSNLNKAKQNTANQSKTTQSNYSYSPSHSTQINFQMTYWKAQTPRSGENNICDCRMFLPGLIDHNDHAVIQRVPAKKTAWTFFTFRIFRWILDIFRWLGNSSIAV